MLDKSLMYYNIIMKRNAGTTLKSHSLPKGYIFKNYEIGDEYDWAKIEHIIGEFDSEADALDYFSQNYKMHVKELKKRLFFLVNPSGEKVGTFNCWHEYKEGVRIPAVHWVGLLPSEQGKKLGKLIVFEGVRRMVELEGDVDMYLHTQTWSYKALNIYGEAGFKIMKSYCFDNSSNEFQKAIIELGKLLRVDCIE